MRRLRVRTGCSKATKWGGGRASENLMWGALKHPKVHRIMGVLRSTLDMGPLKHRIGSCIWDNVKDPIRSFRAPFVLRVWSVGSPNQNWHRTSWLDIWDSGRTIVGLYSRTMTTHNIVMEVMHRMRLRSFKEWL